MRNPLLFMSFFLTLAIVVPRQESFANEWIVTLENANNFPYEKVDKDHKVSGMHIELVEAVAKNIGIKIIWKPLPWSRSIKEVENGEVDAITFVTPTLERNKFMYFKSQNILHNSKGICVLTHPNNKKNIFNGKLESLYGARVGFLKDYVLNSEIEANRNKFDSQIITGETEQLLTMLLAERFDFAFTGDKDFSSIHYQPRFQKLVVLKPCLPGEERFIAFSKKIAGHELKAARFETALIEWKKTSEYKKLLKKYDLKN
jgi:polar amino acid transport system substrate-binding protein